MEIPSLTWATVREMLAVRATTRPPAWTDTAIWAIDTLERWLGMDWPATVIARSPEKSAGDLALFAGHTIAYVHLLELALRLELLAGVSGNARVRRAIRRDPRSDQLVHARMQLELASLALMHGSVPTLEPRSSKAARPADVAFSVGDQDVIVETRAILTSESWRDESLQVDTLFERIDAICGSYGVRCEGELGRLPMGDTEATELLSLIDDHARLVVLGGVVPPLRFADATLQIVHVDHQPARGLTGPAIRGNSWKRISQRIAEKVDAARASGAGWLSLEAHNGLWQFTEWAQRPLIEKLDDLAALVRPLFGGIHGIVITSGPVLGQGTFADEDISQPDGTRALRRVITPLRVRETLIIPAHDPAHAASTTAWREFYAAEPAWLGWALEQLGMPSPDKIFAAS